MRRRLRLLLLALLLAAVLPLAPGAEADPPTYETGYVPVAVGTPDETLLHYKVMLPDPARWGPGPYPAVIDYSGYQPAITVYDGLDDRFTEAGYAVVGLNIRGSACSGGKFDYFEPREAIDGVDAIDWLSRRAWSNGKFAMVGKSYPGITQLFVAGAHSVDPDPQRRVAEQARIDGILRAHLKAIVPGHVFADLYRDVPFPGGILNATFAAGWSTQRYDEGFVVGPSYWQEHQGEDSPEGAAADQCLANQADHAQNPPYNPFVQAAYNQYDGPLFHERSPWYFAHEIETPLMLVEAWQDEQVGSRAVHLLGRLRRSLPWKLVVTNGDHGEYYGEQVFPHVLRFLSYYLPPAGQPKPSASALADYHDENRVTVNWENGAGGDRRSAFTRTYKTWPPPHQTVERLYLTADGRLSSKAPPADPPATDVDAVNSATEPSVRWAYTPVAGSQARGGYDLVGEPQLARWDQRPPSGTYAAFTTAPLAADQVLLGSASLDLWLSSTAPDTDVEVTLSEVRPDGQEMFVQQGWLRASHRREDTALSTTLRPYQTHLLGDSAPLVPGQPTLMRVEIFPFGHVFRAGSRLRVAVAAPHVAPDLWGFAELPAPAVNTIHTSGAHPSSLALPLLARAKAPTPLPPCPLRNQPCRPEAAP